MTITNYTNPAGDYGLVRIKAKQAEILDPETLDKILSILELHELSEGGTYRPLWNALYRSQPFHSTQVDSDGSYWRQGRHYAHPQYEFPKAFLWAMQNKTLTVTPEMADEP